MTNKEVCGIIERCPISFDEYPDYVTLGLRTDGGECYEVFLPAALAANKPASFSMGRRLCLYGGEEQVDPGVDGQADHIRYWPRTVRVEKKPEYLF